MFHSILPIIPCMPVRDTPPGPLSDHDHYEYGRFNCLKEARRTIDADSGSTSTSYRLLVGCSQDPIGIPMGNESN
jgi:hypothetical protein